MNEVIITKVKMPFWSMVGLMLKWTFATIPALIILTIISIFPIMFIVAVLQALGK